MSVTFDEEDSVSIFNEATSGGSNFKEKKAAPPHVLVGLEVRHGALIDGVIPIYNELNADGTLGAEKKGARYGGLGGDATRILNKGFVVVGLDCRQGQYVDNLAINWQKWTPDGPDITDTDKSDALGGPGGNPVEFSGKAGHVVIGIHGKHGAYIDRLSVITAKPVPN